MGRGEAKGRGRGPRRWAPRRAGAEDRGSASEGPGDPGSDHEGADRDQGPARYDADLASGTIPGANAGSRSHRRVPEDRGSPGAGAAQDVDQTASPPGIGTPPPDLWART